ncbi:uncharacterized protein LOC129220730 [Uloborus diversus]|uniref:uncharacterized protein LOC129220730 n=1 Tax=Uloborus diversus TaxID=327109 RepID=UPI00240A194B|nr:uncharacterized protein LOC129220730 [Uloborus diversus]
MSFSGNKRSFEETDSSDIEDHLRDSDDDFIGEPTQEFLEVDDDAMMSYCTQVFAENPLVLPLYYQIGTGFELENAVHLEVHSGRRVEKYNSDQIVYRARVDPEQLPVELQNNPLTAARESVRELFRILIERSTAGLRPSDLIRFCIQADGLDRPISTRLMPVSELTLETVLAAVLKVLQSKDEIMLDSGFFVDIITVRRDVGAGRRTRKIVNTKVDCLKKRSILSIPVDDEGLCCAKAIVYALAHLHGDQTQIEALRQRDRPTLMNRARELHAAAGVPLGPCTFTEIVKFEEHLDTQIVVISADNLNKVSYKGPSRKQRINLYLHDEHFEVIKNLKGFYASNFYCEICEKPYDHRQNHQCPDACRICFRRGCVEQHPMRCPDCDRMCKSEECFNAHKARNGKQQYSMCDLIYQCPKCCKIIQRKDCARDSHICGTIKCVSCDQQVKPEEHLCYLRTVEPKAKSDRLIYFDFETDQSSGEHVVNFAVAHYAEGPEDKREHVFKGYSACADFCTWLFSPIHKDYTVIAHNMKG